MAEQEHAGRHGDGSRLPVPAGDRRPEVRRSALAPTGPSALVKAAGAPLVAPLVAAAFVGATAAAVSEAVSRLIRPWFTGPAGPSVTPTSPASWTGPGVHVSYTHVEVHWPLDR
jgi:hypothetical protein